MIVSHEHGFVFLKTRKTAGTSIEVFLAKLAGPDAIVTPVGPPVEGHEPRNYHDPYRRVRFRIRTPEERASLLKPSDDKTFFNHMSASTVREQLGAKRWNSYFKFCFERDPWEKVMSYYYFRKGNGLDASFRDFVMKAGLPTDFGIYARRGRIAVDYVGQFRSLQDDLAHALRQIGIDTPVSLTREKAGIRPNAASADDLFTPELDQKVASVFRREIAAFEYEDRSR